MVNTELTLRRLPRRTACLLYNGDNDGLASWVVDHRYRASVTATTNPVGALITEQDQPDIQVVAGDYIVHGPTQIYDGATGPFQVYSGVTDGCPPGFAIYDSTELAAWA